MISKRATRSPARVNAGRMDLHMHTDRSDGRYPPDEVLGRAAARGLDLIAITDHDLPNVVSAGTHTLGARTIRVIAGVELSGSHLGREYHLLVYFPGEMPASFAAFLRDRARVRAERYDTACTRLGHPDLPLADAAAHAGERSLTRHHLYRALMAGGHVRDARDGFALLRGSQVVPLIELPYVEAIRTARAHGGLTSWAHPSLDDAQAHARTFVTAGLQGLEGIRPGLDSRTRNGLKNLADKLGLLLTGGSDWHGWAGGDLGLFAVTGERTQIFRERLDAVRPVGGGSP